MTCYRSNIEGYLSADALLSSFRKIGKTPSPRQFMKDLKDSPRAHVRVSYDGRVFKQYRGRLAEERYFNEMRILRYLERKGCHFVPRALDGDDEKLELVMSNCGQPVQKLSQEKLNALFDELERFGVHHEDQATRNVTYDNTRGRFCIIDFEFARLADPDTPLEPTWSKIRWSGLTDCGPVRKRNDDIFTAFTIREDGFQQLPDEGEADVAKGDVVFLVSDGMGGATSGDLASNLIAGSLREMIPQTYLQAAKKLYPDRLGLLQECLEQVHARVNELGEKKPHLAGMGATATLCWFTPDNVYYAHVGDSRLYHYRKPDILQVSEDHTRAWDELHAGKINERQFRDHPRKNILKRVIGAGAQAVEPQLGTILPNKDDWFMLCSDGLIGGLWEKHIRGAFAAIESKTTAGEITKKLFEESLAADGTDNISLATIHVA